MQNDFNLFVLIFLLRFLLCALFGILCSIISDIFEVLVDSKVVVI